MRHVPAGRVGRDDDEQSVVGILGEYGRTTRAVARVADHCVSAPGSELHAETVAELRVGAVALQLDGRGPLLQRCGRDDAPRAHGEPPARDVSGGGAESARASEPSGIDRRGRRRRSARRDVGERMLAQVRTRCEVTERERHRHLVADQLTERPLRDSLCGDPGRDVTGGRVDPRLVRRGGSFAGREPREHVVSRRCMCVLRVGIQLVDYDLGIARAVAQELSQGRGSVLGRQPLHVSAGRLVQVDQTALGQTEQQHRGHGLRDREQLERHGGVRREVGCAARQAVRRFVHDPSVTRHGHGEADQRRLVQVTLRQAIHHLRRRRIGTSTSAGGSAAQPARTHYAEEGESRDHVADSIVPGAAGLDWRSIPRVVPRNDRCDRKIPGDVARGADRIGNRIERKHQRHRLERQPHCEQHRDVRCGERHLAGQADRSQRDDDRDQRAGGELKHRQIDAVEPRDETRRAQRIRGTRDPEQRDCERQYRPPRCAPVSGARESRPPA